MKHSKKIEYPCAVKWESMKSTNESDRKTCAICSKSVFDVTAKNDIEIEKLLEQNNGSLCVKALSYQLSEHSSRKKPIKRLWKKGKFIGLILAASLISQDLVAQQKKKTPDSYHIIQDAPSSDTITIEGIIKGEGFIGWKKLKNASINIWSEENINLGTIQTKRNGKFKFTIDKKIVGANFSVSISAWDYKRIKVETLASKDTKIEVFLEEQKTIFITGRYF